MFRRGTVPQKSTGIGAVEEYVWVKLDQNRFRNYPCCGLSRLESLWCRPVARSQVNDHKNNIWLWIITYDFIIHSRRYCHPDNSINPLQLTIDRAHEWYDPSNPNGIAKHWQEYENFCIGFGWKFFDHSASVLRKP